MIQEVFPKYEGSTIHAADLISNHIFDLLGSKPTFVGREIDWHSDFKVGHKWEVNQYYANVRAAPFPGGYDIKVPWELSRCQHFVWLGQAYWFTNDEKYAQEFVLEVKDWIEKNPYPWGVNWTTSMDVSIRAINWLWGFYFFKASPTFSLDFVINIFKSLLIHGRHIFNNLEIRETKQGILKGNHYLSNIVGLIFLGFLLPEFKEAEKWRDFGLMELEHEILNQVYDDGVNFEASISYHRLVTELFIFSVLLARINGHTFSETLMNRVEKMVEFIMDITKPDGTIPIIGDNDNGRVHRLKVWSGSELEWIDFRYLLAIGSVLFNRIDFAVAAGDQWEEAFWLLGESAYTMWKQTEGSSGDQRNRNSTAYLDAGIFIMRKNDAYMIIDAGPNGQNGLGGHAHNDLFSFELYSHKTQWMLDPGTFTYTSDYLTRTLFRGTSFHNTVMIDEIEQNTLDPKAPFWLGEESNPKVELWKSEDSYDFLAASHDGYHRARHPITHHRRIYFNKHNSPWWIIQDFMEGNGIHDFLWSYHISNHKVNLSDNGFVLRNQSNFGLAILFLDVKPEVIKDTSFYFPGYGTKSEIPVVRAKLKAKAPITTTFLIKPISENSGITTFRLNAQKEIIQACKSLLDIQFIP